MGNQVQGVLSPWLRKKRFKVARPFLKGKILDFGCGVGFLIDYASLKSENYLGVDSDLASIAMARDSHSGYSFEDRLPDSGFFDTIVLLAVIEHLKDPVGYLKTFFNLLHSGGHLVLTTPHPAFGFLHTLGSRMGLFSREASEEHETLTGRNEMRKMAQEAKFVVSDYRRFLFCANQLYVLTKQD